MDVAVGHLLYLQHAAPCQPLSFAFLRVLCFSYSPLAVYFVALVYCSVFPHRRFTALSRFLKCQLVRRLPSVSSYRGTQHSRWILLLMARLNRLVSLVIAACGNAAVCGYVATAMLPCYSVQFQVAIEQNGSLSVRTPSVLSCDPLRVSISPAELRPSDIVHLIVDGGRGIVELILNDASLGLIIGPVATGALLELHSRAQFVSSSISIDMKRPTEASATTSVTFVSVDLNQTSSAVLASSSRLGLGPYLRSSELQDCIPDPRKSHGLPLHWIPRLALALSSCVSTCASALIAGCPESEAEQHVAPWLELPILTNENSSLDAQLVCYIFMDS